MLTVEKVLEVFGDYLKEDTDCEVIKTRRAYIIGMWDKRTGNYEFIEAYTAPEDMKDRLLSEFENYLAYKFTLGQRDELTKEEQSVIDGEIEKILNKLEQ